MRTIVATRALSALFAAIIATLTAQIPAPATADSLAGDYSAEPVTFPSDGLMLRGVLAQPFGEGKFPAYIHTHGSMTFDAAARPPWTRLETDSHLDRLVRHGYVVLLVARRGHRGSQGMSRTYTVRSSAGTIATAAEVFQGAQTEASDLVAAFEYMRRLDHVDPDRIALGGHSIGGLIAILAAAREPRVRAVVSLSGGFSWTEGNRETAWPFVQRAWRDAARAIASPVLIMWSKNDYMLHPDIGRDLETALKREGHAVEFVLYPAFEDNGHALFNRSKGYPVFTPDLIRFLDINLNGGPAR